MYIVETAVSTMYMVHTIIGTAQCTQQICQVFQGVSYFNVAVYYTDNLHFTSKHLHTVLVYTIEHLPTVLEYIIEHLHTVLVYTIEHLHTLLVYTGLTALHDDAPMFRSA